MREFERYVANRTTNWRRALRPIFNLNFKNVNISLWGRALYRNSEKKKRPGNRTMGAPTEAVGLRAVRNSATRAVEVADPQVWVTGIRTR